MCINTLTSLLLLPPCLDSIKMSLLQQLNRTLEIIHRQPQRLLLVVLDLHAREMHQFAANVLGRAGYSSLLMLGVLHLHAGLQLSFM